MSGFSTEVVGETDEGDEESDCGGGGGKRLGSRALVEG